MNWRLRRGLTDAAVSLRRACEIRVAAANARRRFEFAPPA